MFRAAALRFLTFRLLLSSRSHGPRQLAKNGSTYRIHVGRYMRHPVGIAAIGLLCLALAVAAFLVFCDQAVFTRRDTVYSVRTEDKIVALTFDDGPSPVWTPRILRELSRAGIKATFFMVGEHVEKYPEIARQVAREGHEIENHSYDHKLLMWSDQSELDQEILQTERIIRATTGQTTKYFRPPKAWVTKKEKILVEKMGYKTVLWTLNSKDWVTFDDKYVVKFILGRVRPGDIILFHDSGGVFTTEGGDRHETVKAISQLARGLRERGYRCVTISELMQARRNAG